MKDISNKKGFTLIELLAVIVILAIITVIGITTILPYMQDARERAFKIEATNVVNAAKKAMDLISLDQLSVDSTGTESCKNAAGTTYCFTVEKLINLGIYTTGDKNAFSGKIIVTPSNASPYNLYLKKNDEFKITGSTFENYTDINLPSSGDWASAYESCTCS